MRVLLLIWVLVAAFLTPSAVTACFGPKLFIGLPEGLRAEVLYAAASLYLKEKTGVETEQVPLAGRDPLREVVEERVDLALLLAAAGDQRSGIPLGDRAFLVAGVRPREDLQFTTVMPALHKLAGLVTEEDVEALAAAVTGGTPPVAAARALMTRRGWL